MPESVPVPASSAFWNARETNNRRSLVLCSVGAVAGLLIAGFGLFTAEGTRTFVVPSEDAAVVNGVPVLMTDLIGQITTLHNIPYAQATIAQKRETLDAMIREELYVQRGIELGLPTDDSDVRTALVGSTEAVVAQDALTEVPSDVDLRAWYAAHPDNYASEGEMTLREFVLPPDKVRDAEQIVAALRAGATPDSLNLKSSRRVDDGAEFYFAAKIHLGDRLFNVARKMRDAQVSDPVILPDGAHVLVMQHNQPPIPTPYANARDKVFQDFMKAKTTALQRANERFLRRRADIKIAVPLR